MNNNNGMQKISTRVQDKAWLSEESDQQGIVQEIEFWRYHQMVYTQIRIRPRELDG